MKYGKRFNPATITNEQLSDELKKLSIKLGRTPSQNDMINGTDITKRLYLYRQRFGSIQIAQEKGGLDKNIGGLESKYNDGDLLEEILRIKKDIGHTPIQDELIKYGKYPPGAYKRHFGTYNKALEKLNIRHNTKYGQTIDQIKNDIIRIASLLGRAPTAREFTEHSYTVSWVTAANKITNTHSWNNTLKLCGLKVVYNKNLTDQELKDEVIRLQLQIGRVPGYHDMSNFGNYAAESYAYKYGTYVKALKVLGFDYIPSSQFHNQTHTTGLDGQLYKSQFEANISNILYNKQIKYEYEKLVCAERQWTCDFYLSPQNIWLEADGMGSKRLDPYNKSNEKIEFYKNNNYNFHIIKYKSNYMGYLNNLLKE